MKKSFNPCDECGYSFTKQNQESGMCRICEFKKLLFLEEQGKLLKLPCAVGDTVYEVQKIRKRIQPYTITSASIGSGGTCFLGWELKDGQGFYGRIDGFPESYLGVKVFLTREEAEDALKGERSE